MLLQQIVKVKKKKRSLSKLRPVALFSSRLHNSSVSLRGIDVVRTFGGVAREGSGGGCGRKAKLVRTPTFFCTRALEKARARPPAQPPDLNFGTPRAYDLLIMNLNPLFWVNELKEIGQGMKAAGPINSILWCITLARHSSRPLRAFCLYPLCYSLIILSGVRVRVANCADRLSLRMAKDSPNTDTPPDCAQPPWIMPIIPILWFFFFSFTKLFPPHSLRLAMAQSPSPKSLPRWWTHLYTNNPIGPFSKPPTRGARYFW